VHLQKHRILLPQKNVTTTTEPCKVCNGVSVGRRPASQYHSNIPRSTSGTQAASTDAGIKLDGCGDCRDGCGDRLDGCGAHPCAVGANSLRVTAIEGAATEAPCQTTCWRRIRGTSDDDVPKWHGKCNWGARQADKGTESEFNGNAHVNEQW
jgi:hypothetical protein